MKIREMSLTGRMFLALVLGVFVGLGLQSVPGGWVRDELIIGGIVYLLGDLFLNAIWMIVVPVVFTSLATGVATFTEPKKLGKLGGKTVAFYMCTTFLAISLSLGVGFLLNPAANINLADVEGYQPVIGAAPPLVSIIINMVPRNPFEAMTSMNTLQIIFVSIVFGLAIIAVGEKAKPIKDGIEALNEIVLTIMGVIMKFAPYGAFALIVRAFVQLGIEAVMALFAFAGVVLFALALHVIVVYCGALKFLARKSPSGERINLRIYFKKTAELLAFGFASSSSSATIPVTLRAMDKMGVDRKLSAFSIPLGATINMDGTAIYQGISAIFLANLTGLTLGPPEILTILLTTMLASVGTAGVPGASLIMLSVVLTSIGVPMESIAILFGTDRVLDMIRTTVNIFGDTVCTTIVATQEGAFDWEVFRD